MSADDLGPFTSRSQHGAELEGLVEEELLIASRPIIWSRPRTPRIIQ